jgi:hypothetical protein
VGGTNTVALFGTGSPNALYAIGTSDNLAGWECVGIARTDVFGLFGFVDLKPESALRFYRAW